MSSHHHAPEPGTALFHPGFEGHDTISARTFGFWLYMLSDALLFTGLFAAFGVLNNMMGAAGGPIGTQVADPVEGFWQTCAVLASVTIYSMATLSLKSGNARTLALGIVISIVLAFVFLAFGAHDLIELAEAGNGPGRSGFLSAYFVLIGVHGLHMLFGILWMLVMLVQIVRLGFTADVVARLINLRLFWQFQATVWICLYVYVYMIGAF